MVLVFQEQRRQQNGDPAPSSEPADASRYEPGSRGGEVRK